MKPRETGYGKNKILANKKLFTYVTADLSENPDYIEKKKAIEMLGIGAKKTFNYIRTVANGEVYWCKRCKTENLVSEKPNEDNY